MKPMRFQIAMRPAVHCLWLLPLLLLNACFIEDFIDENQGRALQEASSEFFCTVRGQNRRIKGVMEDWYLYVDSMPDASPGDHDSPQAMLDALRVDPPDRFSFLADRERSVSFTEDGQRIGIGITLVMLAEPDDYRVVDVIEDSPAEAAGMARGDRLLSINGRTVEDWFLSNQLASAFGPGEVGVEVSLEAQRPDGETYELNLEKVEFFVDPVTALHYFNLDGGGTAAYFVFRNFIEPARERLDEVFAELAAADVDELILDMRYNGGGRIAVARKLASHIGSNDLEGEVFVRLLHNQARSAERDFAHRFSSEAAALGLDRLVVVATSRTASASELIVNGLRPYISVDIIGERSFGKPVGSYGFGVCELMLFPTAFDTVNADSEGDYFDGLPATCEALDGVETPLGNAAEPSLAQALHYLQTGECDAQAAATARAKAASRPRFQDRDREAWHPVTGGIH